MLAIATALVVLTAAIALLGALGVRSAPNTLVATLQDAGVALYVVQMVGVSFFNQTAELRFAAVPGLMLVGLSLIAATAVALRRVRVPARQKMSIALAVPIPYALLIGLGGLLAPLHLTVPGFGSDIAVSPSPVEAFLLPFAWGLVFTSVGGLIGAYGRDWRRAAPRLLGAWAVPLGASLRVLAAALLASAAVALTAGLAIAGADVGSVFGGGPVHAIKILGAAILALPTLAAAVLVSGFGVPFDWQVDALSHGEGSISSFGGMLPTSAAEGSQAAPGVLALAPLIAIAAVVALGWLAARRSGSDIRLGLAHALRAAALMTFSVWLLALLARVDAQVGGLLGFHLAPDAAALLWRVPLVAFLGCLSGSLAYGLTRGPAARRRIATALAGAANPSRWGWKAPRPEWGSQGLGWRATLSLGLVALPVMLVGTGATGTATSADPAEVSTAPISRAAERVLERDSAKEESVEVAVDAETRVVGSASVDTPLRSIGIAPGKAPTVKAKEVLQRYGELFGLSDPAIELGNAETYTDEYGVAHVTFDQMKVGLPVFAGGIGVHLEREGSVLSFLSSSIIPNVTVAESEPKLSRERAIEVAKKALPSGRLAGPASLQVYAGLPPYISGPNARLAWFVWLIDDERHVSNEYVVDAVSGQIQDTLAKSDHVINREVFDAEEQAQLPGELARAEEDPPTEIVDVDDAYDHSKHFYEFLEQLGFLSYDDKDSPLVSTVRYAHESGAPLVDAYWNGERVVFGEGFPAAIDVVGHEFSHATTEATTELIRSHQSGALNESFSDVMGVMIEMEATENFEDWEVGEDLPNGLGPLRDLAEPGNYERMAEPEESLPYPDHLSGWVESCIDNHGVHINSTIMSHAFYLAASDLVSTYGIEPVAQLYFEGWTVNLDGNRTASFSEARLAVLNRIEEQAGKESDFYVEFKNAFDEVGIDGETEPPPPTSCPEKHQCAFEESLQLQQGESESSAAEMLATLYRARGELALPSAAGKHFLPLYEEHMGRISELVAQDPELAEIAVSGLAEHTPALEGLIEGEGEEFELTPELMGEIEAALERLAEDDRLFGGPDAGELADLIEGELNWMGLPSYGGMDYETGWSHLNEEVESQFTLEESGPIVDPNCTGIANGGYPNNLHINSFWADTTGHRIPGQVSPFRTGGIICGAEVEPTGGEAGCVGEETLNTEISAQLPPGSGVNSTENIPDGSWVGHMEGRSIACAGDETQIIFGEAGLLSLESWNESQCPPEAIACYEARTVFDPGGMAEPVTGNGYAWVSEGEGGALSLATRPVTVFSQGYEIQASFGQFEIELCARAGGVETKGCGGPGAPWIHRNGDATEPGCAGGNGRHYAQAENAAGQKSLVASACVPWDEPAHMQPVAGPDSLEAVSCVPGTSSCVAADDEGDLFYATNVSGAGPATWSAWSGPGPAPGHAVECPSATRCQLAAGEVGTGGGNLYRSSSLGGSFLTSFSPTNGVWAISCPSTSFCVSALGGGFIRYTTNPGSFLWTAVAIGSGIMRDVSCLSASFCAVVDAAGNVRVATTEKGIKEAPGWTATSVNEGEPLEAIDCSSTGSCIALDGTDEVIELAIEGAEAEAERQPLQGAGDLSDLDCLGEDCVVVDDAGGVFISANAGETWQKRLATAGEIRSVSCASPELCASVDSSGDVAMFNPE